MCRAVPCEICSKTTWAGCGEHIEEALAGVPQDERCPGHTDAEVAQFRASHRGIFSRLFSRS